MSEQITRPALIGLYSPYPRMGKSSIATFLMQEYGYTLLKFAQPVKAPLYELGLSEDEIEGALKDTPHKLFNGLSPREKMHEIAQGLFKENGTDFLSLIAKRSVNNHLANNLEVVMDDVRFQENYDLIKTYPGAQIWRIESHNKHTTEAYDTAKLEHAVFDLNLQHTDDTRILFKVIRQHLIKK